MLDTYFFFWKGHTSICLGIIPSSAQCYGMPGIEPWLAACKASLVLNYLSGPLVYVLPCYPPISSASNFFHHLFVLYFGNYTQQCSKLTHGCVCSWFTPGRAQGNLSVEIVQESATYKESTLISVLFTFGSYFFTTYQHHVFHRTFHRRISF